MSIDFYTAPAAAGKTEYVLTLARATAGDLGTPARVCVPTRLQARAWRRRLAQRGGAIGVQVLTFDELTKIILDLSGARISELSTAVQVRLLRAIIAGLPLAYYAAIKDKPGFVDVMQDRIALLKGQLIFPEKLAEAVAALGGEPRLAEMAGIYQAYQDTLHAHKWADRAGLQWLAAEALERPLAANWPLLIVDGFDDFSPAQLAVLHGLGGRVGRLVITLTRAEQEPDFPRYARTREQIEMALHVRAQPLPRHSERPGCPPALAALRAGLFAPGAPGAEGAGDTAVQLLEAADRAGEVREALRWLKRRLVEDDLAPHQVALLARDIEPYRAHIRQVAREFGLPLHLVDGVPLLHNPLIAALLNLLALHLPLADGSGPALPRRPVISAWRSPYFRWPGEKPLSEGDAQALDTLARGQRVIRGEAQWREAFAAGRSVDAAATREVDEEEADTAVLSATTAAALEARFDAFLAAARPLAGRHSLRAHVAWLEELLGPDEADGGAPYAEDPPARSLQLVRQARANAETAEDDIGALLALKEVLRGLVWAEQVVAEARLLSFADFYSELLAALGAAHAATALPESSTPLLAANVQQVRGLGFKAVAVLGLSEGSFPATLHEDPFLRDADRAALQERLGAPLPPSTLSAERETFYETVTRPAERLLLTRPLLADNGAEWVASPFWSQVQRLTGAAVQRAAGETAVPPHEAASWAEWWQAVAALPQMPAPGDAPDQRRDIARATAVWLARRDTASGPWQGDLAALAAELGARFGPAYTWSPSRLERYQRCGFYYFTGSVLELAARPEPAEGLDAAQLGNIYHELLQALYTESAPEALAQEAALETAVRRLAVTIFAAAPGKYGFRATPWWAQTQEEIIANVVASVIALRSDAWAFAAAEAAFGFDGRPALALHDGADRLRVRGFIDRVDRDAAGRVRIIDYKTAGPSSFTARAFAEGQRLQLPLYALAAREALGLGAIGDGLYWHVRHGEGSPFTLAGAQGGVEEALQTAVDHAWTIVHSIRAGAFAPQVPDGGCPGYCPAAGFCAHYSPSFFGS